MSLVGKQRKYLRSLAHHLDAHVIIGKNKLSDNSTTFINELLNIHELIKIKFIDNKYKEISKINIAKMFNCHIVGDIGKILILYRQNEDKNLRKINFPDKIIGT